MTTQSPVLILGAGSAALTTALFLTRCGIKDFIIFERRPGPLKHGQADGVQCRTIEMYESFGIADKVLREAHHLLEVNFWSSTGVDHSSSLRGIRRTNRAPDTEPGLSHQPHVILNQARMNGFLIDEMKRCGGPDVKYGYEVKWVQVDKDAAASDPKSYCVTVTTEKNGKEETFKSMYAMVSNLGFGSLTLRCSDLITDGLKGCDGAHSVVRKSLGFKMVGDSTDAVWGVMDIYPRTNFPDIRKKSTIHSDSGNLLVIPREGGSLVRFYIELPHGTQAKDVKLEDLQNTARKIFHPYTMEISETVWWSAYSIGQRLADHFSESNRIFLTGDACHTHSPKAGQGMNVSLQDGYNMGWKLAAVLNGRASPELLKTYNLEREKVAADLIDFDRYFTKIFSSSAKEDGITPEQFSEAFIKAGKFTAGLTSKYDDSMITSAQKSNQDAAKHLVVGMRFPSTQVVRFCDAKVMQLVGSLPADGRWRILIFPGNIQDPTSMKSLNRVGFAASDRDKYQTPNIYLNRLQTISLLSKVQYASLLRLEQTSIALLSR